MSVNANYDFDGKRDSLLVLGLALYKYSREAVYNGGWVELTPNQFSVLDLLHDREGKVFIGELKDLCWPRIPKDETVKSTICTLNARLAKIHVPTAVTKSGDEITFGDSRFKPLTEVQRFKPSSHHCSSIMRLAG